MSTKTNGLIDHVRRVVGAMPFITNKAAVLKHIFWPNRYGTVEYHLSGGLVLLVGSTKHDRTTVFTVKEIFVDEIYKIPAIDVGPGNIVDLGANVGAYSLYGAMHYEKATIFAVEPDEENFKRFQANIARNSLQNRIIPLQVAVSAEEGELTLYRHDLSSRGHSLVKATGDSITVKTLTLDQFFNRFAITQCNVLKMDIEGAEYDVLFSCSDNLLSSIQNIVLEYHDWFPGDPKRNPASLRTFLSGKGFRIVRDDGTVLLAQRVPA